MWIWGGGEYHDTAGTTPEALDGIDAALIVFALVLALTCACVSDRSAPSPRPAAARVQTER